MGAGVVATAPDRSLRVEPAVFAFFVFAVALCTLFLLEFVAVVIEVTEMEIRFSVLPFYLRRFPVANVQRSEARTYPSPNPNATRYWIPPRHCVELTMKDGSLVTLMLDHPEWLASAIAKAKRMAASKTAN
jgi:hypothetical protein